MFDEAASAERWPPLRAGRFEIVEDRASRLLVVRLLHQVALEVDGQVGSDLIRGSEHTRSFERGLHQFDHCARDVVARCEVGRVELAGASCPRASAGPVTPRLAPTSSIFRPRRVLRVSAARVPLVRVGRPSR